MAGEWNLIQHKDVQDYHVPFLIHSVFMVQDEDGEWLVEVDSYFETIIREFGTNEHQARAWFSTCIQQLQAHGEVDEA